MEIGSPNDERVRKNAEIIANSVESLDKSALMKEKKKKSIINVVRVNDLNVRDISISTDEKYLISCSEIKQEDVPYITVWRIERLLAEGKDPEAILKVENSKMKSSNGIQLSNWILCVDTIIKTINNKEYWFICAGSLNGELLIWNGKIEKNSGEWNFENSVFQIIDITSEDNNVEKAIFSMKILDNVDLEGEFNLYMILNKIQTIGSEKSEESTIKELTLSVDQKGASLELKSSRIVGQDEGWILTFDIYNSTEALKKERFVVSGSSKGIIKKWSLFDGSKGNSTNIGTHEDAVSCLKIYDNGAKVASGSADSSIRIWKTSISKEPEYALVGHHEEILSLDLLKSENLLISASKDNTIKIWDLNHRLWIRNINTDYLIQDYMKDDKVDNEIGLDFIRDIVISPDNRYIFASKKNKIIIFRNFGRVWHFYQQLKYIRKTDKDLFKKIYGENLRQICRNVPDHEDSLKNIYEIIKKRLVDEKGNFNSRLLASLFIPSFVTFENDFNDQKDYITSVQSKYDEYWFSVKNMFLRKPEIRWQFKLYVSTDIEKEIEDANFIEITDPTNKKKKPYIILEDREQSQIRFLLVLDIVPTTFIPLLKAITLDIEDDRGDKDNLIFTDFDYAENNFIKKISDPEHSIEKTISELNLPNHFYYSHCIFKLDEGYSTEKFAFISIRKCTLEFSENLNPLESNKNVEEDIEIFESFKNNFQVPMLPKTQIKIGKGLAAAAGKKIDDFLSRLVLLEFIFTIMDILALVVFPEALGTLAGIFVYGTGIIGIFIIIAVFVMMFKK